MADAPVVDSADITPADELVLVDLSSIAYPLWHMSGTNPDPNWTSQQIVARVRALTGEHPHAAVCCDLGVSFRKDADPTYKANRPPSEAALHHQIAVAKERLAGDGYPIWAVRGYEADDLIATATARALACDGMHVLVCTGDKDLLQLVEPRVRIKIVRDGSILDEAGVREKFHVEPAQMCDYLTLVGDAADNVRGAVGIGPRKASVLLNTFGTIEALYEAIDAGTAGLPSGILASLQAFRPLWPSTHNLIALCSTVELPFEEVVAERVTPQTALLPGEDSMSETPNPMLTYDAPADAPPPVIKPLAIDQTSAIIAPTILAPAPAVGPQPVAAPAPAPPAALEGLVVAASAAPAPAVSSTPDTLAPAPAEWERQLEPRSLRETERLAVHVFNSRMFSAYGTSQAVLTTLLAGRELGLQAMASLRGIHVIDGKPTLAADLIRALVLRSGAAKYFRCTERTDERATFVTQRGDDPPMSLTYTIAEATTAGLVKAGSGWVKNPADMLVARAGVKLARLVYPDVTHGLYTPDEMRESERQAA